MGSGASAEVTKGVENATPEELKAAMESLTPDALARLSQAVEKSASAKNQAFVFIKPHALTDKVMELAKKELTAKGITIKAEGKLGGEEIDNKKLIDNHYYAIAVKATIKKPSELNVPNDKFKEKFGCDFQEVLDKGNVFNAMDGCKEFGCEADGMAEAWNTAKDNDKLVKLGGGFYCGQLTIGDKTLYIMNGFFMSMRSKFTNPSAAIQYYECEWDPATLSWADFRGKVLGPTDPAKAPEDSLRGMIFKDWEGLGLKAAPNTGDNGMHASASPFEGLAERCNWRGVTLKDDDFGKKLLAGGMKEEMIKDWSVDPQVSLDAEKKGSIFDALEDQDCEPCCAKLLELSKIN